MMFVLYGVTDRDKNEKVCQFFPDMEMLEAFRSDLPGNYSVMCVHGANYDDIVVVTFDDDVTPVTDSLVDDEYEVWAYSSGPEFVGTYAECQEWVAAGDDPRYRSMCRIVRSGVSL